MMEVLPTPWSPRNTILNFLALRFDFEVKLILLLLLYTAYTYNHGEISRLLLLRKLQ